MSNSQLPTSQPTEVASLLAAETIGARISFTWLGQTRKLEEYQSAEAAAVFGASAEAVSMSKKLIDTKNAEYKALTAVKGKIKKHFQRSTLPYTEPKTRLLKRSNVEDYNAELVNLAAELSEAVDALNCVYDRLKAEAAERLGSLFNAADYPPTLAGCFSVAWDYPNLAPPNYLAELSPELYARESRRVSAQFEAAAELAENAFLSELGDMVERIVSTLGGSADGKPRIFRNSMIDNLTEFFERFRALSITSSAELENLVAEVQNAVRGVSPAELRDNEALRVGIRESLATVSQRIAETSEAKPARRIRLPNASQPTEPNPWPTVGTSNPEAVSQPAAETPPIATVSAELSEAFDIQSSEFVRIDAAAAETPPAEASEAEAEPPAEADPAAELSEAVNAAADESGDYGIQLNFGDGLLIAV